MLEILALIAKSGSAVRQDESSLISRRDPHSGLCKNEFQKSSQGESFRGYPVCPLI
jgi:hypothetical protein